MIVCGGSNMGWILWMYRLTVRLNCDVWWMSLYSMEVPVYKVSLHVEAHEACKRRRPQ
jgi:hypothetical protein